MRYLNPDLDKTRIITENRNKSGVYRWINRVNNKTYIGSSTNLSTRLLDYYQIKHLLKYKTPIHFALLKYGYSNFILEVLEYCNKNETVQKEQHYFDQLNPEYNVLKIAGSTKGYKHTKATIEKMKTVHLSNDDIKLSRSLARLGFKVSDFTRKRLSEITTARAGIAVTVYNMDTNEEKEYVNITEAAKALNVSRTAVRKAINLKRKLKKIYLVNERKRTFGSQG